MNSQTDLDTGREVDAMTCRACGDDARASEGFECQGCGRFVCIECTVRGVTLCADCSSG